MSTMYAIRSDIERLIPSAFTVYSQPDYKLVPTGIQELDRTIAGIPTNAVTEICGSSVASSGKTSVMMSLLAHASQDHYCALVDASNSLDTNIIQVNGTNLSRLLWVKCGTVKQNLPPLEQAFKVTDILLQGCGFGLIVVDISHIPEKIVRAIPVSTWFRFSRVVEKQKTALVFIEQKPHATSCAGLVLNLKTNQAIASKRLFKGFNVSADVVRTPNKKPVQSLKPNFSVLTQWA